MHVCSPYIKLAITICFSSLVKAYVQQPESSKLKLAQLEQELQKAHQQGIFISSSEDQTYMP
ncbi:unnamed protein product [Miscanthus lutarioriparius]|uniref:Uncharacterized protein n=1 Tax=Miscanthus lutarioriparius TaxID=422564 RepID=A0A811P025_9POAL|nr:unnamed protein product [Miscanthus lutarioriparius]